MYILELDIVLPHKKDREKHFDFIKRLHQEIGKNTHIKMFEKAFVAVIIFSPPDYANKKAWDSDNRALHLVFNNLKGVFFSDDDFEHMSFGVFGAKGVEPKTIILIESESKIPRISMVIRSILDTCKPDFHRYFGGV